MTKIFENCSLFGSFGLAFGFPSSPSQIYNLNFHLVPKMLNTKFENNWNASYQEVKNVQLLTDDNQLQKETKEKN
jgi:hypothetical protein